MCVNVIADQTEGKGRMGKEGWQDGPTLDKLLAWQEATLRPSAFNGTMNCRGKRCQLQLVMRTPSVRFLVVRTA